MSTPSSHPDHAAGSRPVGVTAPADEQAVRALAALEDQRLADAEQCIDAIPESPTSVRAWKLLLRGLAAVERHRLTEARPLLLEAATLAFPDGPSRTGTSLAAAPARANPAPPGEGIGAERASPTDPDRDGARLAASALHHVGRVYRRQDRPDEAYRTHLAAYELRQQWGSFEELWETAVEIGLDADVARRFEEGQRWHRIAVETARRVSEEPLGKEAIAWTNLSMSCTDGGNHGDAVAAARTARECWRRHDVGTLAAAQADATLGTALLKQGESLHEGGDERAGGVLAEAVRWLTIAREALTAFGPDQAAAARFLLEQQDFAKRLLASLALKSG